MGKEKKSRKHAGASRASADPTGQAALANALASSPAASAAEHAAHQAGLLAKLDASATPVQKAVACSGIAHILANQLRPAASLVTRPLLTKLLPLLVESHSYDVAISAAGAVRNISAIGSHASGAQEVAAANACMSLLLNGDACSIIISTLEAEKTQWMDAITDGATAAASASSSSASPAAAPASSSSLQPVTALDKRCHFLSQMVSALSNMIEHFDVVLGYFLANTAALAHVLNILDDKTLVSNSEWGTALRVEISNLLMMVSEGNPGFMSALPGAQGQEVVAMLLRRLDPATTVSPQVRTQCAGVLLNMMDKMIPSFLAPASASLALPPPGQEAQAGPAMGMGAEQTCVTRVLATLSSMLDLDPEALGARLVAELNQARQGLNAQLHAVDAGRKAQESQHKRMAEARHASKLAAKAAAGGGTGMEDEGAAESSMGDDPALAHADASSSSSTAAPGAESNASLVAEESSAALADAFAASDAAASAADADTDVLYADAHDAMESTHKDASGAAAGTAGSASKRSPEVLLAAQWAAHLERSLGVYRQSILAVRMALELLTNLASTDEDSGTDSSSDSESDSAASLALNPAQLGYIPKLILQLGLLQKIGQKCSLRLGSAGSPHAGLLRDLHAIYPTAEDVDVRVVGLVDEVRMRAINAANNLVLFLPVSVLAAATAGPAAAGSTPVAFLPALFTATCTNMHGLLGVYASPPALNVSPVGMQATEEMQSLASLLFQVALKAVPTMQAASSSSVATQTIEVNEAVMQMLLPLARAPPTGFEQAAPAQAASSMAASASSSSVQSAASSHQSHQHAVATAFALAPGKRSVQLHVIYLLALLCEKHAGARAAYHERVAAVLIEALAYAANVLQAASRAGGTPAWLSQIATASSAESSFMEVAGEALNGLVDLFSEDAIYAAEQQRLGLIPAIQAFLPLYDAAIKLLHKQARQLRVDPGLIERLGGHAVNAKEFVKYKLKHP